jgi:1-acyl-sn-glycerol-3-phosphate acyltransferase
MNMIKNILGRIFALWALVYFAISMILIIIPIWITALWPEPKKTIYVFKVFRVWMGSFFLFPGVRRTIKGRENFVKNKAYVVVCNHRSFMDPPLSSPSIPGPNKTIAKAEMAKIPIFNIVYKRGGVLVDRKSEESRRKSYLKMKEVLNMGFSMCIYPEGTRNKTSEPLTRFHDGAFKLAIESKVEVIPSIILGTTKVLPTNKTFFFWPHPVQIHFLPPVSVENKTVQELKEEVFNIMKNYYLQHQ